MRLPKSIYASRELMNMAHEISKKLGIPAKVVLFAYKNFWEDIRDKIKESDMANVTEDTEIDFPLSYSIQHLGKLYTSKDKIVKINNLIKNKRERDELHKCEESNTDV